MRAEPFVVRRFASVKSAVYPHLVWVVRRLRCGGRALWRRGPGKGKIERPSVEYNLTEHCNLACHGCDHASPLLPEKFASLEQFKADLGALAPVYHAREFRILGGEPLLHPHVVAFTEFARACGIADRIVVITNGTLLHKAEGLLFKLVDEVRMSVYPQVRLALPLERYADMVGSRGARFTPVFLDQFYRTLLNQRIEDLDIVRSIFRSCKMAGEWSCHSIHEGRYYKCAPAPFMGPRLARLGITLDSKDDGVVLHAPDLRSRLERYLADAQPLASCSFCLGTSGPLEEHHLLNRKGVATWWEEDHRSLIGGLRRPPEPCP
jgi:organic radical activating enzyme